MKNNSVIILDKVLDKVFKLVESQSTRRLDNLDKKVNTISKGRNRLFERKLDRSIYDKELNEDKRNIHQCDIW